MGRKRTTGQLIAGFRKAQGWTQAELADKVGLTKVAISQYECGLYEPRLSTLRALAKALRCDPVDLLGRA
jgi:transcriptional regulator with XRE-family HTH domain